MGGNKKANFNLSKPVLFLIFNRFETTKKVFEQIRAARPPSLYIGSDGPREDKEGEKEVVERIRNYVIENIDWDCNVQTLFRQENLGCKKAVYSAIEWFFTNEEMGIILEDDCLPSKSFFEYTESLLEYYKNDTRVGLISGHNFGFKVQEDSFDYFFSKYIMIWGWASWRRAWQHYDVNMKSIGVAEKIKAFNLIFPDVLERYERLGIFRNVANGKIDTWDFQWSLACLLNNFYTIIPKTNQIQNIGFGEGATHTSNSNALGDVVGKIEGNSADLKHPPFLIQYLDYYRHINPHKLTRLKKFIFSNLKEIFS